MDNGQILWPTITITVHTPSPSLFLKFACLIWRGAEQRNLLENSAAGDLIERLSANFKISRKDNGRVAIKAWPE